MITRRAKSVGKLRTSGNGTRTLKKKKGTTGKKLLFDQCVDTTSTLTGGRGEQAKTLETRMQVWGHEKVKKKKKDGQDSLMYTRLKYYIQRNLGQLP